jgi:hypothetical protein
MLEKSIPFFDNLYFLVDIVLRRDNVFFKVVAGK